VAKWSLFAVAFHGVISLAWVIVFVMGLRMLVTGSPVVGVALVALGSVTIGFTIRRLVRELRQGRRDPAGDLPQEEVDYLVWTSFAVPMLLAGLLVVLLITGGLGSR
jgi:uncharacterized membrane protein